MPEGRATHKQHCLVVALVATQQNQNAKKLTFVIFKSLSCEFIDPGVKSVLDTCESAWSPEHVCRKTFAEIPICECKNKSPILVSKTIEGHRATAINHFFFPDPPRNKIILKACKKGDHVAQSFAAGCMFESTLVEDLVFCTEKRSNVDVAIGRLEVMRSTLVALCFFSKFV
jgi:hypothetical protein